MNWPKSLWCHLYSICFDQTLYHTVIITNKKQLWCFWRKKVLDLTWEIEIPFPFTYRKLWSTNWSTCSHQETKYSALAPPDPHRYPFQTFYLLSQINTWIFHRQYLFDSLRTNCWPPAVHEVSGKLVLLESPNGLTLKRQGGDYG